MIFSWCDIVREAIIFLRDLLDWLGIKIWVVPFAKDGSLVAAADASVLLLHDAGGGLNAIDPPEKFEPVQIV